MLGTQKGLGPSVPVDSGTVAHSRPRVPARQPSGRCQAQGLFVAAEKGQVGGLSQLT